MIDFSSSPYVAVFFAFSGIRPHDAKKGEHAVIYCLNTFALAGMWARDCACQLDGSIGEEFTKIHNKFLYNMNDPFRNGYESGILKYLNIPASWNRRMQRQRGVFLYDTLNYKMLGCDGLEAYLGQSEIPGPATESALTKVIIPHKVGREIYERLQIMGVTATHLYDSHEAVAIDVVNRI